MINLSSYLRKELIRLNQKFSSKEEALIFIAKLLAENGYVNDEKKAFEDLKRREEIQSTGIGNGIAVPHLLSPLDEPVVGFITIEKSIDFNSVDGKPVDFLFFTAASNPNLHLRMLARLARLVKSTKIVERIRKTSLPEEASNIFKEEELKL